MEQYQPDSPGWANNNNADNNYVGVGFHISILFKKSLSQMNEKGLSCYNTSHSHSVERIIMLIIIMFEFVVIL